MRSIQEEIVKLQESIAEKEKILVTMEAKRAAASAALQWRKDWLVKADKFVADTKEKLGMDHAAILEMTNSTDAKLRALHDQLEKLEKEDTPHRGRKQPVEQDLSGFNI